MSIHRHRHRHRHLAALASGLLLALPVRAADPAPADDPHAACKAAAAKATADAARPASAQAAPAAAAVVLEDLPMVDQDGTFRRFRSEVVGGRLVVMDFVFTTCTTICPVLSSKMARLQERLGDRLGREVFLVSVSVDPARDGPPQLLAYSKKWKARQGWSFLGGKPADVEAVLKGMGAYTANFANHPPMFLVGDGRTGKWTRLNGFPEVDQLLKQVDTLAAARAEKSAALGGSRP